jgi:hypothetical protein
LATNHLRGSSTYREPWPTRALMNVKDTKILQDAEGIYNNINFI